MTKYIGRRVQLGVGRETTRGTGVAPTYQVPTLSFDFDDKVVKARSTAGLGLLEDSEEAFVTTRYGEGSLEAEIRARSFGYFLYAMLATPSSGYSVSGPTDTAAYTHTFTLANSNQHQSLTFLAVDPNTTEQYELVMLNELEIVVELDEVVKFTASFLGKRADSSSNTMPALVDEPKFTKKHLAFKVAASIDALEEATAVSLKSLRLRISKNVILDDVLGTAEPEDILNRQVSVEGEITLNYEDETWKNYMKTPTDRAVEIRIENTDELIAGCAATYPLILIEMPKVDFFDWAPNYALDEIVSQTVSFKGHYDTANAQNVINRIVLVNAVVSY